MFLQFPTDRLSSQLFQGNNPPNINYNMINVQPQLVPVLPYMAHALAISLSEKAQINPLRAYTFNKFANNGFNNQEFLEMISTATTVGMRNNINFNDYNSIKAIADQIVNHYCAIEYRENMQMFTQMLDQQTSAQLYEYLSRNNLLNNGMFMGNNMQTIPMNNGMGVNSGYITNSYAQAPSSSVMIDKGDDRYSTNIYGDNQMDRTQHNMGITEKKQMPINVPAVNRQINTTTVKEDDLSSAPSIADKIIRTNGKDIACKESFGSFSDLADKVFTDHEQFFKDNTQYDFNYIRMNGYEYSVGLAPFTNEVLSLSLKRYLKKFFNGEIGAIEMNQVILKTPKRLAKILNMYFDTIKLLVNNLLAQSKCGTRFDDNSNVVDDMEDLLISLRSKGRPELLTDLKIALEIWVEDLFDIREFVDKDGSEKEAICYKAMTKVDAVIVNLTSGQLDKFNYRQLDFLCEMRSVCVYIITTNNVLYSVTFCSQYVNGELRHYVPIELKRLISLF